MKRILFLLSLLVSVTCFSQKTTIWNLPVFSGNLAGTRYITDVSSTQTRYVTYETLTGGLAKYTDTAAMLSAYLLRLNANAVALGLKLNASDTAAMLSLYNSRLNALEVSKADKSLTVSTQSASYTAVLSDADGFVQMDNASANNFTIPPNSSVAFPVGTQINIVQIGAGQTTIVAGAGVTVSSAGAALKLRVQYSSATAIKTATDTWLLLGDLTN